MRSANKAYLDAASAQDLDMAERLLRHYRTAELRNRARPSPMRITLDLIVRIGSVVLGYGLLLLAPAPLALAGTVVFAISTISFVGSWFHESIHANLRWPAWATCALRRLGSAPLGLGPRWWVYKHVRLHHPFVGDPALDPDIQFGAVGRVSLAQPWKPSHRTQHIHMWLLFPFATFNMLKPGERRLARSLLSDEHFQRLPSVRMFLIDKYLPCIVVWLPVYIISGPKEFLTAFAVFHLVAGTFASVITQAQHNTDLTLFDDRKWVKRPLTYQLIHSADVGSGQGLWWWLSGGVTLHTVHHLVPTLSFLELPGATRRLRTILARTELQLQEHRNMRQAMTSHFRLVRALAQPDRQYDVATATSDSSGSTVRASGLVG
jgi:linoleoyl-CoA desaturase